MQPIEKQEVAALAAAKRGATTVGTTTVTAAREEPDVELVEWVASFFPD